MTAEWNGQHPIHPRAETGQMPQWKAGMEVELTKVDQMDLTPEGMDRPDKRTPMIQAAASIVAQCH